MGRVRDLVRPRALLVAAAVGLAAVALAPLTALAEEHHTVDGLAAGPPTGYIHAPASYTVGDTFKMSFAVTNTTLSDVKGLALDLTLSHLKTCPGVNGDVFHGLPGQPATGGPLTDPTTTSSVDPSKCDQEHLNPIPLSPLSVEGDGGTTTVNVSAPLTRCGFFQFDVSTHGKPLDIFVGGLIRVLGCGITTKPSPGATTVGQPIADSATVTGFTALTGTVTFKLFAPGDTTCDGSDLLMENSAFHGLKLNNGSVTSPTFTATQAGTYQWVATYGGETPNEEPVNFPQGVASNCGDEPVTVTQPGGGVGQGSPTPTPAATLASTGDPRLPISGAGALVALVGLALMLVARKRGRQGES